MSNRGHYEEQGTELDSLRDAVETGARRERELGASLVEAHDRLLCAEDELMELRRQLTALGQDNDVLRAEADSLRGEVARRDQRLLEETVWRERLQAVAAVRLYYRLRNLPGMGGLRRRRAKTYEDALASAPGSSGNLP